MFVTFLSVSQKVIWKPTISDLGSSSTSSFAFHTIHNSNKLRSSIIVNQLLILLLLADGAYSSWANVSEITLLASLRNNTSSVINLPQSFVIFREMSMPPILCVSFIIQAQW